MTVDTYALEFVDRLERREMALLTWGLVDGCFSADELVALAVGFLAEVDARPRSPDQEPPVYTSGADLVDAVVEAGLVWQLPFSEHCRTRMAETVRLLARLRQLFPGGDADAWRNAPTLVADYRLQVRPRVFPKRETTPDAALAAIRTESSLTAIQVAVARALLGGDQAMKLAGFQVRAAARVLRSSAGSMLVGRRSSGTVVCAGTGSGKTLAFYLPAYMAIADRLTNLHWTQCLAVYPRNELLKDQLRESLSSARRVAPALEAAGRRRLVIGALFGEVPYEAGQLLGSGRHGPTWRRTRAGGGPAFECPFVRCPDCGGPAAWPEASVRSGEERLVCCDTCCGAQVGPDEIRLTRQSLLGAPPDVLFTTTEMLNQRMSSARYGRLFGVGASVAQRPHLVLLDEIHTYEGVHGAHVGLLLRRWRHLAEARPHFVGLSATLAEAPRFFGDLVGLRMGSITGVSPAEDELETQGSEYLLALRGDPSTGTSLLSTTIQTCMLLRRVLAPEPGAPCFGQRVFVFTDNLDVTNRLFHNLLDAEGLDAFGRPLGTRGSLAHLRASTLPKARDRFEAGQNWAFVETLGHSLATGVSVPVGRTSSQDSGVDRRAEIVVATSSLEVGFDDPDVGAVLQHKAPHSAAAFLQRKGRAGRRRDMRPWTVLVLSDFGRDRAAYQAYDQLFSPQLPARHLPLGNRAVLRIQGTYALFDWLARSLPSTTANEPWTVLSQPAVEARGERVARDRQLAYADRLRALLEEPDRREDFARFLRRQLDLDEDTTTAVLWEPPRAILTEAVPTLLRRLERNWRRAVDGGTEHHKAHAPLPEFVPRALFSDLQLAEVLVRIPAQGRLPARDEPMPLAQALREYSPGRVSRRYGVVHAGQRHWIDPGAVDTLSIDTFCPGSDRQPLGRFAYYEEGERHEIAAFRPYALQVTVPPPDVHVTSNSTLQWRTQLIPSNSGHEVDLPIRSTWSDLLESIRIHTHHLGNPVEVRRFAIGAVASVGRTRGGTIEQRVCFVDGSGPAALGFVADVDAIEVRFRSPDLLRTVAASAELLRGLRPARFRDGVLEADSLNGLANAFQRDWLATVYLTAVVSHALRTGETLEASAMAVVEERAIVEPTEILDLLLQWAAAETDDGAGGDEADDSQESTPRRIRELGALLADPSVRRVMRDASSFLWAPLGESWAAWLAERFKSTLAAAFVQAAHDLCPQLDVGGLLIDPDAGPIEHERASRAGDVFWLTEATTGGAGVVESFLSRYAEDPRRFLRLVEAALGPSDLESAGEDLGRVLDWVSAPKGTELAEIFAAFRGARSHADTAQALTRLRAILARAGIPPARPLIAMLNARVLRPGTTAATDAFLGSLRQGWIRAERDLGIEIDLRVFAMAHSEDDTLEQALGLEAPAGSNRSRAVWRQGVLSGLLWPRGARVRTATLRPQNPFVTLPEADRLLATVALRSTRRVILNSDGWFAALVEALTHEGAVEVVASAEHTPDMAQALLRIAQEPIDAEILLLQARVSGVRREADQLIALIELPEALQ